MKILKLIVPAFAFAALLTGCFGNTAKKPEDKTKTTTETKTDEKKPGETTTTTDHKCNEKKEEKKAE